MTSDNGSLARALQGPFFRMSAGNDEVGCPADAARAFFALADNEHARRLDTLRNTLTVDDWLAVLLPFSVVNEAQFLVYSILRDQSKDTKDDPWSDRVGAYARERAFRLKEFDEYAAHSYANGMMSISEKAFSGYRARKIEMVRSEGFRAAKRQAITEIMRLEVPQAIAVAALSGLDKNDANPIDP